jgi:predicted transcriptional regulator
MLPCLKGFLILEIFLNFGNMDYTIKISDDNIAAEALVKYLKTLDFVEVVKSESADWYDELTDDQKKALKRGEKDLKAGRVTSHKDVQKEIRELIQSKKSA